VEFVRHLITPKEITPKEITPKEITPKEITPKEITPKEITPKEITKKRPPSRGWVGNPPTLSLPVAPKTHAARRTACTAKTRSTKTHAANRSPVDSERARKTVKA
jgi:hypothetical protein